MDLSNRELAAFIWIGATLGYIFVKDRSLLALLKQVLRILFLPKIIVILLCAFLWIILCVQGLSYIDMWEGSNLKTTILWGIGFAFVTLMDVSRISEDNTYFKKTLRDAINVTAIITFIAEAYSFPLLAELVLFPFLFSVTAMHAISEKKKEHASAHKLMSGLLITVGFVYIGYGLYMAATDVKAFVTWNNLREFSIPIILSLLFLPYLYLISILVSYELTLVSLRSALKNDSLRRYAMFKAVIHFRFDLEGLRRWKRNIGANPPENREAIRESISEIKKYQNREKMPFDVPPEIGWCPVAATKLLLSENLQTSDYHRTYDGEWWASSSYVSINKESLLPSNIAYYISGDEHAVKRLKLVLNVNHREDSPIAEKKFFQVCKILLQSSVSDVPIHVLEKISHSEMNDIEISCKRIRLLRSDYVNSSRGGYSLTLTVDYSNCYRARYD